jgi:hypothetical protein
MKLQKFSVFIIFVFLLQSCSPFGQSSLIEAVSNGIADFFDSKTTSVDFGVGGHQAVVTNDSYKVTYSLGSPAQSPVVQTAGGYTVMSSIKTQSTIE